MDLNTAIDCCLVRPVRVLEKRRHASQGKARRCPPAVKTPLSGRGLTWNHRRPAINPGDAWASGTGSTASARLGGPGPFRLPPAVDRDRSKPGAVSLYQDSSWPASRGRDASPNYFFARTVLGIAPKVTRDDRSPLVSRRRRRLGTLRSLARTGAGNAGSAGLAAPSSRVSYDALGDRL